MFKKIAPSLFVASFLLVTGCGKENQSAPNPVVDAAKITNFETIKSTRDKKSLANQTINVGNIEVTDRAGNPSTHIFIAGDGAAQVPVYRLDAVKAKAAGKPVTYHVTKKDKVRVVGIVKTTEIANLPTGLSPTDTALLAGHDIYIEAAEVTFQSK